MSSQVFVYQSSDVENQAARRVKAVNTRGNAQGGPKRAALGVITNQVNQQVRVQPARAAKSQPSEFCGQDENTFVGKKSAKPVAASQAGQFAVYVDQPTAQIKPAAKAPLPKTLDRSVELTEAVTALPQQHKESRIPLITAHAPSSPDIICLEDSLDSPMVLDLSTTDEIKKPIDREAIILTVPEYEEDIYTYLREAEQKNRPKPGYMKRQQDITSSMRSILVDWLVEVSEEYKLHRETLFLAVNYIDRFLSKISVLRGKLQLVGAASMFLASKYEEIYPPDVSEFAYITDDTYTKQQVLRMEHLVLKVLTFDVAVPTANWFCEEFLQSCDADLKLKAMTMFLCELTLVDMETYIKYLPSEIAAASLCLARYSLGLESWPESIAKKSRYEVENFAECLEELHKTYKGAATHPQQAVVEKYTVDKFQQVSDFTKNPPPHALSLFR